MFSSIQVSFAAGELSPSLFGRVDLEKYKEGCSTLRNWFVNYQGGVSTRAGLLYIGTCLQTTSSGYPPRDIPFQYNINQGYVLEFDNFFLRIKYEASYITESPKTITGVTKANPGVVTIASHGYSNGDWVFISGVGGMTELNGLIWVVAGATTNTFTLIDMFGNAENTTSFPTYTSGGTAARIYTVVSPYAAVDLPYLKFTQSANTMSLCCVNTQTLTEYPPYDLQRVANTNWVFTKTTYASLIAAPATCTVVAQASTTLSTYYSYIVTAINADGDESVASPVGVVQNNDISVNAGSNTITWSAVPGAVSYNIYAATPSYNVTTPIGASFGFLGSAFGTQFTDTNITADFTSVPPLHENPFARTEIESVNMTANGSGYSQSTVGYTVTTSTGTGFSGFPIVVSGAIVAFYIQNNGQNYAGGDTIVFTGGSGATATLTLGPATGTYPGTVAYFQQRRGYADTLDNPDTYYFSKTGLYTNMDAGIPPAADDAVTGNPWAQQVNGIQWMIPMPNGLIVLTGNGGWLLNGINGGALTPASQQAIQQANVGCSALVPPILINSDILYVQSKNSIVRDLTYNFFTNIYMGEDKTILSNHLFINHSIVQWAYAEEPYKVIWCVRDDGILLSFTWLKEQNIWGWARHDTNGLVVSVCTVTQRHLSDIRSGTFNGPITNAVYVIVKRYVNGQWLYYSEQMDDRIWETSEDCFCVDAGLTYPMTFPNATLTPAALTGTNNISSVSILYGGAGYTSPVASAVDETGVGTGALFTVTVSGGVITAVTPISQGQNYTTGATQIFITDSTGTGAVVQPVITNIIAFNASASVFSSGNVGNIIRADGGIATITSYVSGTQVKANVTQPLTDYIPNDPNFMPTPAMAGNWSMAVPTTVVTGLNHLTGQIVSILADGSVVTPQRVVNNSITLPHAASAITIGEGFICQLQSMYLEPPGQATTTQGKRKLLQAVTLRLENSRGLSVGTNQVDASTLPNSENVIWSKMAEIKERNPSQPPGTAISLFTGDTVPQPVYSAWAKPGQVAVQTTYPLGATVLALLPQWTIGDTNG